MHEVCSTVPSRLKEPCGVVAPSGKGHDLSSDCLDKGIHTANFAPTALLAVVGGCMDEHIFRRVGDLVWHCALIRPYI